MLFEAATPAKHVYTAVLALVQRGVRGRGGAAGRAFRVVVVAPEPFVAENLV